jgi:hypothetical protein
MVLDFEVVTVANPAIGRAKLGVVSASDPRLTDARPPAPHTHGPLTEAQQVTSDLLQDGAVTASKLQAVEAQTVLANVGDGPACPQAVQFVEPLYTNQFGQLTVRAAAPAMNTVLTNGAAVLVGHGNVLWGPQ